MSDAPELLPCPFCGSVPVEISLGFLGDRRVQHQSGDGCGCPIEGHICLLATWNTRADLARPRVKELEWGGEGTWDNQPCWHADSAFGWVMIVDHSTHGNGFRVYPPWEESVEQHSTLEAAQAATQADFERRIMECLL